MREWLASALAALLPLRVVDHALARALIEVSRERIPYAFVAIGFEDGSSAFVVCGQPIEKGKHKITPRQQEARDEK
jgi:hypothetical protein